MDFWLQRVGGSTRNGWNDCGAVRGFKCPHGRGKTLVRRHVGMTRTPRGDYQRPTVITSGPMTSLLAGPVTADRFEC